MVRKKRLSPRDLDFEAQVVAWLRSQRKSEKLIAQTLGLSQPEIARLKRRAEDQGWLETRCIIPAENMRRIQRRFFPYEQLVKNLNALAAREGAPNVREVRIFESGGEATDPKRHDRRLAFFGRAAAGYVADLLSRMEVVGVSWGKTLSSVVQALRGFLPSPPRQKHQMQVIPVCGLPLDDLNIKLSSSSLAAELHEIVNGKSGTLVSLGAVPARIPPPKSMRSEHASDAIYEFIGTAVGYNQVFLGPSATVHKLDSILTSVGSAYQKSTDPWFNDLTSREGLSKGDVDRLAIGDISGVFLERHELTASDRSRVQGINERWTGIRAEHIAACARRAALSGRPGVVVLAIGSMKAAIVRECVRRGLVNELIIDQDLAKELGK